MNLVGDNHAQVVLSWSGMYFADTDSRPARRTQERFESSIIEPRFALTQTWTLHFWRIRPCELCWSSVGSFSLWEFLQREPAGHPVGSRVQTHGPRRAHGSIFPLRPDLVGYWVSIYQLWASGQRETFMWSRSLHSPPGSTKRASFSKWIKHKESRASVFELLILWPVFKHLKQGTPSPNSLSWLTPSEWRHVLELTSFVVVFYGAWPRSLNSKGLSLTVTKFT